MLYESESGDITMAFTGDAMICGALMPFREERFLKIRDLLHGADVRFTNGEMLFHNYEDCPTYLTGTYMRCDPRFLKDLEWMGINLMACANNHGYDFGENGVLTNLRNLEEARMVHAGSGSNYAEAVAPAYLQTAKGRVALISVTTSGRANSRAGEQRRDVKGRPGVNLVRWISEWTVDAQAFEAMKRIAEQFEWKQRVDPIWIRPYGLEEESSDHAIYFPDRNALGVNTEDPAARFVLGTSFERHTRLHRRDFERNLQSVREARRMADWVVYSIHSHEGGKSEEDPSEHVRTLAHAAIDAGVDIVTGQGLHRNRGIEIYKGKPIFYSLGNFIKQNNSVPRMPHDNMVHYGLGHENTPADFYDARVASTRKEESVSSLSWRSAVSVATFQGKKLREIKLHPIELGFGLSRSQAGRPVMAQGTAAREILERFQRLSEPFQTKIDIQGEIGVIRVE